MELREATPTDAGFLLDMLVEACNWSGEQRVARDDIDRHPQLKRYVSDWPHTDDFGVVAVDTGVPIGAAWARRWLAEDPGYGFVTADVPELSIAVVAAQRHRRVGRRLLQALLDLARHQGWRALSLSVENGNRDAQSLYRAAGFVTVGRAENSGTMLLELRA